MHLLWSLCENTITVVASIFSSVEVEGWTMCMKMKVLITFAFVAIVNGIEVVTNTNCILSKISIEWNDQT